MIWFVFNLAATTLGALPPTVHTFDLTYALRFDANNPAQVAAAWDHVHTVATLQGIVNRDAPRLYVRFVSCNDRNIDDYWMSRMTAPGQWLARQRFEPVPDLMALIALFRKSIQGVVVYDPQVAATSNLASTIAGVENLIAVRFDPSPQSVYSRLVTGGPKLPVVLRLIKEDGTPMFTGRGTIPGTSIPSSGSAKCDAYLWLKHHYIDSGKVNGSYAGYYIDQYWMKNPGASQPNQHTLTNHDFFVAKRAFFFDLGCWEDEAPIDDPGQKPGTDVATLRALLLSAYQNGGKERMIHIGGFVPWAYKYTSHPGAGGKHEPVPSEWKFVELVSAYNGFIDADAIAMAAMANASFFAHFPLKKKYPQRWVTTEDLTRKGYLDREGNVRFDGREFMIFYVGDYDAAAWLYQFTPSLWDHPARGRIPLMWAISPVLERRAPMAMDYIRRTASKNDYFVAADNGAGYLKPGLLQEPRPGSGLPSGLDAWAAHCKPLYERWGLSITGFIIDISVTGLNKQGLDCYASFSPNGIIPQHIAPSLLHGQMPVMKADHDLPDAADRAVQKILERVERRHLPFHWFRAVLKPPDWYASVLSRAREVNPKIELLDAPTYFELYRRYLQATPDAAQGRIPYE